DHVKPNKTKLAPVLVPVGLLALTPGAPITRSWVPSPLTSPAARENPNWSPLLAPNIVTFGPLGEFVSIVAGRVAPPKNIYTPPGGVRAWGGALLCRTPIFAAGAPPATATDPSPLQVP